MARKLEIVFPERSLAVVAELLESEAPITGEEFWHGLSEPWQTTLHHGGETGPELWCFVSPPAEELPYENSTVFPEAGDILYYHYIQPPTRDGVYVYDIGIYYGRGCSKLRQGWIPGNLFARLATAADLARLTAVGADLLGGHEVEVILRRAES
jgi:hypothetical protein